MTLDDELCHCFHVTGRKLVNWVRLHRPRVPSQLADCGGAGTGCGWCIPFLKLIFERGRDGNQPSPRDDATGLSKLTAAEYARLRAAYLREKHCGRPADPPASAPES